MGDRVFFYVLDTMSDWESGYVVAELNSGRFFARGQDRLPVCTVGADRTPVRTLGGIRIEPELTVDEVRADDAALLLLVGADTWLDASHQPILDKAAEFLAAGVPVAPQIAATVGLAASGLLDGRRHTGNDPDQMAAEAGPGYRGHDSYERSPAVTDGDLVTAGGTSPVEFARHVFDRLGVFSPDTVQAWYELQTENSPESFRALLESLPAH